MPYLNDIKRHQTPEEQYKEYLQQRKVWGKTPAFYMDIASFFFTKSKEDNSSKSTITYANYAALVLSAIADLGLEDPLLLRIIGYKLSVENLLTQAKKVFEKVKKLRNYEPQSARDLALVLADLGGLENYIKSIELLQDVVVGKWDSRYSQIEVTAFMELNRVVLLMQNQKLPVPKILNPKLIDSAVDCDVRISLAWDTDDTDIDLHINEPNKDHCYYGHRFTAIGGTVSRDFTQGYGPEEYFIKQALPGTYETYTHYYANHKQSLAGGTTLLLQLFTNFARPGLEKSQKIAVRLQANCDHVVVGTVKFEPTDPDRIKQLNSWLGITTTTSDNKEKKEKKGFLSGLFGKK